MSSLTGKQSLRRWGTRAGVIAGAVSALAPGCAAPPKTPTESARHLYIGLDTSGSFRPYLGLATNLCVRQAMALDADRGDRLTIYRMDCDTEEFTDGLAPESGDRLQRTLIHEVASVSRVPGTYPGLFWTTTASRIEADSGPVTVAVYSDGDNDAQTVQSVSAIKAAARRLAANRHVMGVWVFGAQPRNWKTLRSEMAPLGNRFHLGSPTEMTAEQVVEAVGR